MTPDSQPDDDPVPRIQKILKDYPGLIAAINVPPSDTIPGPGTREKDSINALSKKLASFEQGINSEIKKASGVFWKIRKRIESELAGLPTGRSTLDGNFSRFARPDTPDIPAVTGQDPGKSPVPRPYDPPPAPVRDLNSRAGGGVAVHLLSAGAQAPAASRRARRWRPWLIFTVLFPAAAGFGIWWYLNSIKPVHKVFPLSYTQPAGLAVKGASIFSADPQRQLLFTLARENGKVKAVQKFPNRHLSGLAAGDDCLWSTDLDHIYRHNMDSDFSVRRSFANPGRAPGAVYWSGDFLWIGDLRTATVSKYATGESLALVKQYALPEVIPAGFYISGNFLWVLDPAANKITRYLLGPTLNPVDFLDLGSWTPAGSKTTGFAIDASDLFFVTENPAELHHLDLKNLNSPSFQKGAWQQP